MRKVMNDQRYGIKPAGGVAQRNTVDVPDHEAMVRTEDRGVLAQADRPASTDPPCPAFKPTTPQSLQRGGILAGIEASCLGKEAGLTGFHIKGGRRNWQWNFAGVCRILEVGATGFEPATSWSRTKRSKP